MRLFGTFLLSLVILGSGRINAATITLNSGAGSTFLDSGLTSSDFPSPFSAANFLAAQTGSAAFVLTSTPFWIASLADGPGAKWIGAKSTAGTGAGDTALYAIGFNLPTTAASGSLTLYYAVDNSLGHTNAGIYINGTALPNTTGIPGSSTGSFGVEHNYTDSDIGSLLVQGTNWLYFDGVNLGGPAGLIFAAQISTSSTATPEPGGVFLVGGVLIGWIVLLRRSKPSRASAI